MEFWSKYIYLPLCATTDCDYRALCRNIKLTLFETIMSFPTQGQKHLNKWLPLDMELFDIRSFQCYLNFIFAISSVMNNIVWVMLHLGRCLIPTERSSGLWALSKPSQEDHWEKVGVSLYSLGICVPSKKLMKFQSWETSLDQTNLSSCVWDAQSVWSGVAFICFEIHGQYKTIDM